MNAIEIKRVIGDSRLETQSWGQTISVGTANRQVCRFNAGGNFDRGIPGEIDTAYAQAIKTAFNGTWACGINPDAVPELLRRFKVAVTMLAGYMAETYDAPQNDYNELEGFENVIRLAEL